MSNISLTAIQLSAVRMVAIGIDFSEIVNELGVSRSTLYRWRSIPSFASEVSRLISISQNKGSERMIRDIEEIKEVILITLIDVAQNDSSGSARVSAARVLNEMILHAEERSSSSDVMLDQSDEIKGLLKLIHEQSA